MNNYIEISGAKEHNLKNIDVKIPKNKLVVITGVSGSGKSTLVFDIINKEGQRQYLESLGWVTDFLSKPNVKSISGLSPTISINQYLTNRSPRSTVGTITEVYTYLRVLYAKIGIRKCKSCGTEINPEFMVDSNNLTDEYAGSGKVLCPKCLCEHETLIMAHFSFNKPEGMCPECTGLGETQQIIIERVINENLSISQGAVAEWDVNYITLHTMKIRNAAKNYGFELDLDKPIKELSDVAKDYLLYGSDSNEFKKNFPGLKPPKTNSQGRFEGLIPNLKRRFAEKGDENSYREKMKKFFEIQPCSACNGERLNSESRKVTIRNKTLIEISKLQLDKISEWLNEIYNSASPAELRIIEPIYNDLIPRIQRLLNVGVGYLSLERPALTLSGGESQRLRLASLLGSGLTGVLYVLDEPTIGLHASDTEKLIRVLKHLRDLGNTVLVIEHDIGFIRCADYVIDIGPGAGKAGGEVVAMGAINELHKFTKSKTAEILAKPLKQIQILEKPVHQFIRISGANEHNLKNIDANIPVGMLTAVTGVSGSGKSTLVFEILEKAFKNIRTNSSHKNNSSVKIDGLELFDELIIVDQQPIGRIPRSNAATYTDAYTDIRKIYAGQELAKKSKLSASHFSFNVEGGRCPKCNGAGVVTIEMHFLPDVEVNCPVCRGKRFQEKILEVKYKEKSIADVLDMTVADALEIFNEVPSVYSKLKLLSEVGLDYLHLGQPATTLSGGEAQRIKLSRELSKRSKKGNLYLLDEPTTGLHVYDIRNLIKIVRKIVADGHTVVVVEHNLDLIREADWIIDLGPGGGDTGGEIMFEGPAYKLKECENSLTAKYI